MRIARHVLVAAVALGAIGTFAVSDSREGALWRIGLEQTPDLSQVDVSILLNGSMGDEFIPGTVLQAFIAANPDLFPGGDLSAYGVIPHDSGNLPVGFSIRKVDHLGGLDSWGVNCVSCHSGLVERPGEEPLLVLGMTGTFDAAGFFNAVVASTFRAGSKEGIGPFLEAYARACGLPQYVDAIKEARGNEKDAIEKVLAEDPFGGSGIAAGELHRIDGADLELNFRDLPGMVHSMIRLFHNMRVALHVPEPPPALAGTPPGPGRNDAFGLLAAALLGVKAPCSAPVKYGIPWNLTGRKWVHWDGNTNDPAPRNVLAAMGLGCPDLGKGKLLDYGLLGRMTEISERLRSPKYPFTVDAEAARRGKALYDANCARCHDTGEDERLFDVAEIGTDPNRARIVDQGAIEGLQKWLGALEVDGFTYDPSSMRATGKYWASPMESVWARAPYLHNGSVRTMRELLARSSERPKTWKRGSRAYDEEEMGFQDDGSFVFDATLPGNSNAGHEYGVDLSDAEKRDLVEYLKTR